MHPFVNVDRNLIFWWSPKCGCTTAKSIMLESMLFDHVSKTTDVDEEDVSEALGLCLSGSAPKNTNPVHRLVRDYLSRMRIGNLHAPVTGSTVYLERDFAAGFTNVLFVRDPFKRFVSGFVDKHVEGFFSPIYRPGSFKDAASNIDRLDPHHFAPQTSEAYLPGLEYDRVFDIERIDYEYLSGLLGMKVKPRQMNRKSLFAGGCPDGLADLPYEELARMKATGSMPDYDCFYDEESRSLVSGHYAADFDLMRRWLPASGPGRP
jgi:hypothetical protein